MRKVDPTIKVIASGATPEEASWCYIENRQFGTFEGREKVSEPLPFAFGSSQDWTGALLKTSADYIDYLGEHFYGYPNLVIDLAKQAVRRVRRAPGAQGPAAVEPGAVQVRGVGRVPEAVALPEGQGHQVRVRRVVSEEPGGRRRARRPSTTRC